MPRFNGAIMIVRNQQININGMETLTTIDRLTDLRRPLTTDEVEFRVQSTKYKKATVLAYKTARTDTKILDESGLIWQRKYDLIDGKLFCGIGIYFPEISEFVWRWDTGTPSNMDADKGHASDAFKRAGFAWGIGVELYDFPRITIPVKEDTDKIYPASWTWAWKHNEEGKINNLAAKDRSGKIMFHHKG